MSARTRNAREKPRPTIDETMKVIWPRFNQIAENVKMSA